MSPLFFSSVTAAKTAISSEDSLLSCDRACIPPLSSLVWVEIALGGLRFGDRCCAGSLHWLGFFYIAGLNLIQHRPQTGD